MEFNAAIADPNSQSAEAIAYAIDEAVQTIPYMVNRTVVTVFNSIKDCEENMAERKKTNAPWFNVVFANTDSLQDYQSPLQKLGTFTPVIKVSAEADMNMMFLPQVPTDYMTFPLQVPLVSRVLRSCCAMNRLSQDYITSMDKAKKTVATVPKTLKMRKRKYIKCEKAKKVSAKKKKILKVPKATKKAPPPKKARKVILPKPLGAKCYAVELATALPIDDSCFTVGLIDPETGSEFPSLPLSSATFDMSDDDSAATDGSSDSTLMLPGKMVVSLCAVTLVLTMVRADPIASSIFNLDGHVKDINLTTLFGFATDHRCIQDIQLAMKQSIPLTKYIIMYASDPLGKIPVPVHLSLTPVTQRTGAVSIAVVSVLEAGMVGRLQMQARGF